MGKKEGIIGKIITIILTNFPIVTLLLTVIFVLINYFKKSNQEKIKDKKSNMENIKSLISKYTFLFMLGLTSLWAGIFHIFFSKDTSKSIGWASNGFQKEIGFVNLGLALLGFMSFRDNASTGFKLATILITNIFLL